MRKKIIKFKYFLFFSRIGQLLAVAVVLYFLGTGFSSAKNLSEISKKDAKILLDAQGIALPSGTATDSIAPTSKAPEVPNERLFLRAAVYNHSERFPTAPMPANLPNTAPEVNPDPPG